jgi:hypothetical protein
MSYENIIKNAKLTYIKPPKNFKFSKNESHIGTLVIPKCSSDIRFRIGKYSLQLPKFKLSKEDLKLPLYWQNYSNDEKSDKKFRLSTRPINQGICGSCFAVAISTCISDNFIFNPSNPLDYNPSISPMYILSCVKDESNNKCHGGNPSGVIDLIIKSGISTNCGQDYSKICTNFPRCDGPGNKHFEQDKNEDINDMIPECGYCASNPDIYYIKDKTISYDIPSIKQHLMTYGTAIGGFIVLNNFMHDDKNNRGKYLKTNGIYINSVDYSDDPDDKKYDMTQPVGGHAICVVGWGVDTISFTDRNGVTYNNKKIEYWLCRNSWGDKWGYNGYFKYAMYRNFDDLPPIQLGVALEINNSYNGTPGLGGIILIKPDYFTKNTTLKKVDCNPNYECDEINRVIDYKETKDKDKETHKNKEDKEDKEDNYFYFYLLFGVIVVIFLLYFFYGKKHKRSRSRSRRSRSRS